MPDAGWAVGRLPPTLARGIEDQIPVSTSVKYVTTRHQRFTRVRLLKTHLTELPSAFSHNAHHKGSLPPQLVAGLSLPLPAGLRGPAPPSDKTPPRLPWRPPAHPPPLPLAFRLSTLPLQKIC